MVTLSVNFCCYSIFQEGNLLIDYLPEITHKMTSKVLTNHSQMTYKVFTNHSQNDIKSAHKSLTNDIRSVHKSLTK